MAVTTRSVTIDVPTADELKVIAAQLQKTSGQLVTVRDLVQLALLHLIRTTRQARREPLTLDALQVLLGSPALGPSPAGARPPGAADHGR